MICESCKNMSAEDIKHDKDLGLIRCPWCKEVL